MTLQAAPQAWWQVQDAAAIPSPALLIYRERLEENLRRMVARAGGAARLRPHIKTHKMREVIELQLAQGITKFKCATIAEAELAALAGVPDCLLAYQPVGPNQPRVAALARSFPKTKFSVIADDAAAIRDLSQAWRSRYKTGSGPEAEVGALEVLLDVDVGQHQPNRFAPHPFQGILPVARFMNLTQRRVRL